jgi:hypothetical protein
MAARFCPLSQHDFPYYRVYKQFTEGGSKTVDAKFKTRLTLLTNSRRVPFIPVLEKDVMI